MSESPGPGGDAENVVDIKANHIRPAQDDESVEAVPLKIRKVEEKLVVGEEENEDADALNEEQDLVEDDEEDPLVEEVDFGDDDEAEASDVDDYLDTHLGDIDVCQTDIETLNKQANDEILKVEQRYNKLRQPVYARRNTYINKIPHFWATVFSRHSQLKKVLTKDDLRCLMFMTSLQVDDFEDSRSDYQIKFSFAKNIWFTNSTITKQYHLPWNDSPSCECTPIHWKPGMNLTNNQSSFFSWFCSQEDASTDDIAEIIKEELWPNPLQYYFIKENGEVDSDEESEEDDEGAVYVDDDDDDDDVEYISSEGEEQEWAQNWRRPPALGKEGPGTSKREQYIVDDDDVSGDELEGEDAVDIENHGKYGYEEGEEDSSNLPLGDVLEDIQSNSYDEKLNEVEDDKELSLDDEEVAPSMNKLPSVDAVDEVVQATEASTSQKPDSSTKIG